MAGAEHLGTQFHEMTRDEFEQQPGTWFHGSTTGQIGHAGSFHVGTKLAAAEALGARIDRGKFRTKTPVGTMRRVQSSIKASQKDPRFVTTSTGKAYSDNPTFTGGRIVGPMTNTPKIHSSRGPGNRFEIKEGIPWGAMEDWQRKSPNEAMSDVRANAVERGAKTSGRLLRRGMYYVNAAEGGGRPESTPEHEYISAVLPNRQHFKTHEDYLVDAREAGKKIPARAMKGYKEIPGQGRLW